MSFVGTLVTRIGTTVFGSSAGPSKLLAVTEGGHVGIGDVGKVNRMSFEETLFRSAGEVEYRGIYRGDQTGVAEDGNWHAHDKNEEDVYGVCVDLWSCLFVAQIFCRFSLCMCA